MSIYKKSALVLSSLILLLQISCKERITDPITSLPELIGFQDKLALRMAISEPYLYVCGGSEGVWKKNIREYKSEWQYLGLRDTSLGKYPNVGAMDFDVLGEDILVAYNGSAPHISPANSVSVWRSTNGGQSWFRSDSGIPETISDPYEFNTFTTIQRSPHQPNIVIGGMDVVQYRSTDGGSSWSMLSGTRGVFFGEGYVRWNPFKPGEIWCFGETAVFAPLCISFNNFGLSYKNKLNWDSLGCAYDGAVWDIAFDAGSAGTIYIASSCGLLKSTDGGYTWDRDALHLPNYDFTFRMIHHPYYGGVLYLTSTNEIYVAFKGGLVIKKIGEIEGAFITSIVLDSKQNNLFIGTSGRDTSGRGIYKLKL